MKHFLLILAVICIPVYADFKNITCSDSFDLEAIGGISELECIALESLWDATDGPNWFNNKNWDTFNHISSWYGIDITEGGDIIMITLPSNNLHGFIPRDLSLLTDLQVIDFSDNQLSGEVPYLSLPNLFMFIIFGNKYLFSDIEPTFILYQDNFIIYLYHDQHTVDESRSYDIPLGDDIIIEPMIPENLSGNDQYQWYKDGQLIPAANSRVYIKRNASKDDEGLYTYNISNLVVSNLILESHEVGQGIMINIIDASIEKKTLDIDGNGQINYKDGLIVMRYMMGLRGNALIQGAVSVNCTRCDSSTIETYLQSYHTLP